MSGEWPSTNARLVAISSPRPGRPRWTVMSLWESASFLGSCTELSATYASLPEAHAASAHRPPHTAEVSQHAGLETGPPRTLPQNRTLESGHYRAARKRPGGQRSGYRPASEAAGL